MVGVDLNVQRVASVNSGASPIDEPQLDALVAEAVSSGRFCARLAPVPADAFVIAVLTPIMADRTPGFSQLYRAADDIAPVLQAGDLIFTGQAG